MRPKAELQFSIEDSLVGGMCMLYIWYIVHYKVVKSLRYEQVKV